MTREVLLNKLPPFSNRIVTIRKNQTVKDIVNEVLAAHDFFSTDYDLIAEDFNEGSNIEIAKSLFNFLKKNVRYNVESEVKQTTKSPAAILVTGTGDCKHFAGFIGGVLDALKRAGKNIDWNYRFASYNWFDSEPGHVFAVLHEGGKEVWIDPVLKNFNERLEPSYILDKRPKNKFMLSRVSGVGLIAEDLDPVITDELSVIRTVADMTVNEVYELAQQTGDESISPEITKDIAVLVKYGIMDSEGRVNDGILTQLSYSLPIEDFELIAQARLNMQNATISGIFGDIWNGVKKVGLAIPRNAYLMLVRVNAFGLASKLKRIIFTSPNNAYSMDDYRAGKWTYYTDGREKLSHKWQSLGGNYQTLENATITGMSKPAILGVAPAIPAWVATASAIIAALTPLITSLLKQRQQETPMEYPYGVCADGYTPRNPDGSCPNVNDGYNNPGAGSGVMDFIKNNPLLVVGAGAAAAYYFTLPKGR